MGTETKARPEAKVKYTSLSDTEELGAIMAVSPKEAWDTSPDCLILLIEGATATAIGAQSVKKMPKGLAGGDIVVGEDIKEGDECTIVLGDPYRIGGAIFRGKEEVYGTWFAFEKGGIPFYVDPWEMVITYINGKRVVGGLRED